MKTNLQASTKPLEDLQRVAYAGQDPRKRMYRAGYTHYMNEIPVLKEADVFLKEKVQLTQAVMNHLADDLKKEDWVRSLMPPKNEFNRTILALESPEEINGTLKEGKEIIVAKWGIGFSSPVHGHAAGYMHEELIFGKIRINTYRQIADTNVARPLETVIIDKGLLLSTWKPEDCTASIKRRYLIHSFTAIEPSASLHYVPEHTRDGRDNIFVVQHFENIFQLEGHLKRVTAYDAHYSRVGEVYLVRSENTPDYGDHYIVVTGGPVLKPHGLRIQDRIIEAGPEVSKLFDGFAPSALYLLKLDEKARTAFLEFQGITVENGNVEFPNP